MSMISSQIDELRVMAQLEKSLRRPLLANMLSNAADTIDELRELVTDYFNAPCVECNPWDEGWQGCKHCDSGNCNLAARALKLGVEVEQ